MNAPQLCCLQAFFLLAEQLLHLTRLPEQPLYLTIKMKSCSKDDDDKDDGDDNILTFYLGRHVMHWRRNWPHSRNHWSTLKNASVMKAATWMSKASFMINHFLRLQQWHVL